MPTTAILCQRLFPYRMVSVLAILAVLALLSACGRSKPDETVRMQHRDPTTVVVARNYSWEARSTRPQPRWNPRVNMVVVRSDEGLGILQEGAGNEYYVPLRGGQEAWDPQWWGSSQVIFGPRWLPRSGERARRFEMPTGGLVVADVGGNGAITGLHDVLDRGYAPRPGVDGGIFAQYGEDIILLDQRGEYDYWSKGFFPVAQGRNASGVAYQTTPAPFPDYWTGREDGGELVIRWRAGTVDLLPRGRDPAWAANGTLLVTQHGDEGPQVLAIDGPGAGPRVLASEAQRPAANPRFDVVAVEDVEGGIRLLSLDGSRENRIARRGARPQWNHDGTRLLIEEPRSGQPPRLRVLVLVWRGQRGEE